MEQSLQQDSGAGTDEQQEYFKMLIETKLKEGFDTL
jgi:hypothetical protein